MRGFPTPSVEWTKDDVLLETEGSTLSLSSVDSDATGSYTCTATSPVGSFDSQSTNLTVIGMCLNTEAFNKVYKFGSVVLFLLIWVVFHRSLWYF